MDFLETITCRRCDQVFFLFKSCYRGQAYCQQSCRDEVRAQQLCQLESTSSLEALTSVDGLAMTDVDGVDVLEVPSLSLVQSLTLSRNESLHDITDLYDLDGCIESVVVRDNPALSTC